MQNLKIMNNQIMRNFELNSKSYFKVIPITNRGQKLNDFNKQFTVFTVQRQ